jgi:hypothetical protein
MFGNPVLGPRIVPFGSARLPTDVLPNDHPAFRVTQRFNDWDAIFNTRKHGAMDLGNFHCGDAVVAMMDGVVTPLGDANGAIGQNIDHGNGYSTQYWHLSRRVDLFGQQVKKGRTIGYVGKTGLNTAGCHLHVVVYNPSRVLVDPWPLLDQNKVTTTGIVKFNAGVDGVNLRTAPDARQNNVYATAYKDPKGIVRRSDGQKIGNTSAQRLLYAVVRGSDGQSYNKLRLQGTGTYQYVQSRFMHRV